MNDDDLITLKDASQMLDSSQLNPAAAHHISNLIQQLKNYPLNPDALRPAILRSIERIERHQ